MRPLPYVSATLAVSLDGFVVAGAPDDHRRKAPDTYVMGRRTWDTWCGHDSWHFEQRVVVMTNRPAAPIHGETIARGDLRPVLERLYLVGAREVSLWGGAVIRDAVAARVVRGLSVLVVPRLLRHGTVAFEPGVRADMRLVDAHERDGRLSLHYEIARPGLP